MAIADGTYEVLTLMDTTMAMDISGNSDANSASVILWSRNGQNNQKWLIEEQGGYYSIRDAETGKGLDVFGDVHKSGQRCIMYTYSGATNQRWKLTEVGTETVNGTAYTVVTAGAFNGSSYMLDVTGQSTSPKTVIEIWTPTGGANQKFVLVPTEWLATSSATTYQTLPTPTLGGAGTSVGSRASGTIALTTGTVYPCWKGVNTTVQLRYRIRKRKAGGSFEAWSDWKSISNGSTSWYGWGTPGQSNCTATQRGDYLWSQVGVSVNNSSTYDLAEIEWSVREWSASWGAAAAAAHGEELTWTTTVARSVTMSDIDAAIGPNGIVVSWNTDATTKGNVITIKSPLVGTFTTDGAATGNALVPQSVLTDVPATGDTVSFIVTIATPDGVTAARTESITLSYGSGHASGMTLTATVSGKLATVTCNKSGARLWLVIPRGHGVRFVEMPGSSPWTVAPPLGVQWQAYAATDSSTWNSLIETFDAIAFDGLHVTTQDMAHDMTIAQGAGDRPTFEPTYSRSATSAEVMGRERPVNALGSSTGAEWSVQGTMHGGGLDTDLFDVIAHAGHVYFRGPDGFWAQAYVREASIDLSTVLRGFAGVTVSLTEEVW